VARTHSVISLIPPRHVVRRSYYVVLLGNAVKSCGPTKATVCLVRVRLVVPSGWRVRQPIRVPGEPSRIAIHREGSCASATISTTIVAQPSITTIIAAAARGAKVTLRRSCFGEMASNPARPVQMTTGAALSSQAAWMGR
jgi:hypothetical protein